MPVWSKPENDQRCRQWARDVSNMFKLEFEAHSETVGKGIEGGASVRGSKGAELRYGAYVPIVFYSIDRACDQC